MKIRTPRSLLLVFPLLMLGSALAPVDEVEVPLPATEEVRVLAQPMVQSLHELVIDPRNPRVMYWALGDVGVLKSTDGGATWEPKTFGLPNFYASAIAMDPTDPDHLMLGFHSNFYAPGPHPYRSVDGGERWEPTFVCEREDGVTHLRHVSSTERMLFDPTDPSYFYYLVHSQHDACGGFYRSCDQGQSYDRNPRCIAEPEPRPVCAEGDPEPDKAHYIASNDASILEVHMQTGELYGTTDVHPNECALMTSPDKGATWSWEDVVDTRGTFLDPEDQMVASLYVEAVAPAPTDGDVRYAAASTSWTRCSNGKAYPQSGRCPGDRISQPPVILRWFGEMSGNVDCEDSNDCDGDPTPDRVWRPIFDGRSLPGHVKWLHLLGHPKDPHRVFIGDWSHPNRVVMLTPADPRDPSVTPWKATVLLTDDHYISGIVQDPANDDQLYVLMHRWQSGNKIVRLTSTDRWQTWEQTLLVESDEFYRIYDLIETRGTDGTRIVAGTSTGLHTADELGADWILETQSGRQMPVLAVAPSDPDRVFTQNNRNVWISDGGFDELAMMDDQRVRRQVMCTNVLLELEVDPDDPGVLYAATGAGIWIQPDAHVPVDDADEDSISLGWTPLARTEQGLRDEYVWSLGFDPTDRTHNSMLAGTRSGGIYQSSDRGLSWRPAPLLLTTAGRVRDVQDLAFQGKGAFAASSAGVLFRPHSRTAWRTAMAGDRISDLAPGASGDRRVYAAGDRGLYRTVSGGRRWEALPISVRPPHSVVLETVGEDGRHHLWVSEHGHGLYRVSTTVTAAPGEGPNSAVLSWTEDNADEISGYLLHYGRDPDRLRGRHATEGRSPIQLKGVTSATLSGLDFSERPVYVALQGIGRNGRRGPLGLPLSIQFEPEPVVPGPSGGSGGPNAPLVHLMKKPRLPEP